MISNKSSSSIWTRLLWLAERDPRRTLSLALRAREQARDPLSACWATFVVGRTLLCQDRGTDAQPLLTRARDEFQALGQVALTRRCHAALLQAGPTLDQQAWEAIIDACAQGKDAVATARAQLDLAAALNRQGNSAAALDYLALADSIITQQGTCADQVELLRCWSVAWRETHDLAAAERQIQAALTLLAGRRAPRLQAICLFERAATRQRQERFTEGIADLTLARRLFARLDLPLRVALCDRNTAAQLAMRGEYAQALVPLLQARAQFVALDRQEHVNHCDLNLGAIAQYLGLYDLALAAYQQTAARYEEQGLGFGLIARRNQAMVLRAQGHASEALALLNHVERTAEQQYAGHELAEIALERARVLCSLEQFDEARVALALAHARFQALGNLPGAAECLLEQGWLELQRGAHHQAYAPLQTAAAALADRPAHLWRVTYGLGHCAASDGNQPAALAHYRAACTTVAAQRAALASEHASSGLFQQAHALIVDALLAARACDDAEAALVLSEQQRALAFQRQLASPVRAVPAELRAAQEQQRHIVRNLADQEALSAALATYTDLLLRVRHSAPLADQLVAAPFDLPALRVGLNAAYPAGWQALVYARAADQLLILTVGPHDVVLDTTPFDSELIWLLERATAPRFRRHTFLDFARLQASERPAWQVLHQLSNRLLPTAVQSRLRPTTRMLIVPTGPLHAVPWAALRLKDSWLCEQAILQLLPALAAWPTLAARPVHGDAALLIGCGAFGERARPLPHVAEEIAMVAQHWLGPTTRLEQTDATATGLRSRNAGGELARYRLIHVASHAQLVPARGLMAHIKLHDTDLWLDEVGVLDLSGPTVVLSTCDGAAGDVLPGEEVLSLSWAFLTAGARDVVANLWPTYDRAAQTLIAPLYNRLSAGDDPAQALAAAQRLLASEPSAATNSPLVWGGLQLIGSGTVEHNM